MKALLMTFALLFALPSFAKTVWIDVRTPQEYASGHILNASNMPHQSMVQQAAAAGLQKDDRILLYCRSGNRSAIAKKALEQAGYRHVQDLGAYADLVETGAVKVKK
ncbi:thiosulfate sulfurtransferase [Volucribacter psittacicida]|uniref:Thiosulfate sulfurtransferase n=1 Tax=Volucribacter psittacicida TaxID=203482 RepID=A0A4R1G1K2_9PAST|nr:rhodanese-like domain-containing protein [Volucribacter psittacicida]TCJ98908.1 thiosulfate sulfurtransferase [Volucribacter psittacicida]